MNLNRRVPNGLPGGVRGRKFYYFLLLDFYAFGFSRLSTKYETTKPPAMRVVSNKVIQNNHHSFYNEGVQAIKIRKNGDYNG